MLNPNLVLLKMSYVNILYTKTFWVSFKLNPAYHFAKQKLP